MKVPPVNIAVGEAQTPDPAGQAGLAGLTPLLAQTLPPGASVAVAWEGPLSGIAGSHGGRDGASLLAVAAAMLAGGDAGLRRHELALVWTLDANRIQLLVQPPRSLPG